MPISTIAREFRHPLGNGVLTPSNDGDGYYVAFGFDEANPDLGGSFHLGADWNGEGGGDTDIGEPVYAIGNAIVVDVVSDQGSSTSGFGNYVVLRHELPEPTQINGQLVTHVHSLYAHLDNVETLSVGQSIGIGQKIGELGKSGNAAFAHLHFEITLGDTVPTQDDGYNPAGAPSDWVDPIAFVENWVPPPFVHIRDLAGNGLRSFLDDFSVQTGAAVAATVQAEYAGLSGMTVEDSNDLPLIGNWFGRSLDVSDTLANIGAVTRLSDQLHRLAALDADVEAALAEQSQAEATAFATGIDTLLSDLNASLGDLNNSLLDDYIDLFETTFSFTFGIGGAIFDNYVSNPLKSVFTVIEVGVSITETAVTFGLQGPEEYFDQHPEQLAAIDLAIQFATKSMAAISSINVTSLLKPNIRPEELIDLFKEISNNFSEFLDLLTSSGVAQTFGYNLSTAVEARDALNGGNLLLHHQKFKEILGPLKLNIAGEVAAINLHAESNPQIYGGVLDQVASYASVLASAIDAYFAWTEIGALSEAREQAGSSYERDALEVMTELKIYEFSKSVVNAIESLPFLTETPLINEIKTIFEAGLEVVEGAEYEKLDELDDLYRESLPLFSAAVDQGASLFATALASLPSEWGRDQAVRYVMADDELKYDGLHYDDDVLGNDLENVISGGAGADDIRPSSGADTVYAQGGQDVVYAGDGNDFVYGGEDNDYLKGEGDNDQLFGEGGDDTVSGDGGLDSLYGGDGDDTLNGGDHGDLLKGEADADFLHGEGGNDTLYGDAGADFLSGGSGADSLIGGSGADTFVYGMDALPNGLQSVLLDEIRDYNQGNSGSFDAHEGDKIDISAIVGAAYASGAGEQIEALWKLQRSPYNNKLQLLVDADGSGNTYSWTPLLFLDGVSSGADIEVIVEPGATTGPAGLPVASDPGSYTIAPSSRTVTEDDITIQFTLTRPDDSLAETVYVSTTQDRGSSNNGDYDFWLNVPVTFAAGDDTETVTIRINEDNSDEALETFGLIVQSSPDQPASQYLASGSFTIIDDDAGGGSASFTEFDDDEWITPSGGNEAFDALAGDDLVTLDLRGWSSVNSSHSSGVYTFRGDGDEVSIQNAETLFVITGSGDDSILTGSGTDGILSGSGNDYINAGAGRDVISAGAGDDTITGIGANEIIAGGEGVDLVTFYASSETSDLILNLGTGQGLGGSWTGVERVSGTFGSGDDTVVAGAQVQNLNGGSGVDFLTLDYTGQLYNGETATRVSLQLQSSNTDLVYFGTTFFGFRLDGFERFDITATAGDDYIYTHTGAYNDTIRGGAGNDTIHANGGNDVIEGGAGDDHITGGDGADVLNGGSGDDRFYGVNSGDVIVGGSGVDEVTFDLSSDTTGASFDLAAGLGANGSWTGIERITGTFGSGDDTVVAGAQVQNLNGGSGVDFLTLDYTGQLYNGETATRVSLQLQSSNTDLVYFGTTFFGFRLDGFERFDITATAGDDYIYTHTGAYNDTIRGGAGNDTIHANGGNDVIEGGAGDDRIDGGDGYDWLVLGIGNDTVDGGADRDMVSFSDLPEVAGRTNLDFMLTLDLGAGTANLFGGETNTLNSIERVTGSIFTDVMRGSDGNDELRGIGDYDWFIATPGNDTLDGGNGLDMVSFVEGTYSGATVVQDVFSVDGGPPTGAAVGGVLLDLTTPANNVGLADGLTLISVERVTGSSHQDVFFGDSQQNDFRGLGGYDWFVGSTGGRERYFGGDGIDTVTYFQSTSGVGASLRNSSYIVSGQETGYGTAGDAVRDLYYEIENLVGSNFDDSLTGNEERNQLSGLDGDDIIFGYGNIDYLKGGDGNDTLDGGAGSDFALYDGNLADYTITRTSATEVEITGAGFTDMLSNVEYFQFDDADANIWQFAVV